MTTIKRPFTNPADLGIDEKLAMLTSNYKPLKQEILTEAQDQTKKRNKHAEQSLQSAICKWLRLQHPDVYFISDFAAGMHLSPHMASIRASQAPKMKVLDLAILEPRSCYHGLILELKTEEATPYLKDGKTLKKSEHLEAQQWSIDLLKSKGYAACFGVGFEQVKSYIEKYLAL